MINITIHGAPVPLARPRVFGTKNGKINAITPQKSQDAKRLIAIEAMKALQHVNHAIITTACRVDIVFYMPIPKWRKDINEGDPHISRPDKDNLEKLVLDALTGVIYEDDSLVYCGAVSKVYSANPRTEVRVQA